MFDSCCQASHYQILRFYLLAPHRLPITAPPFIHKNNDTTCHFELKSRTPPPPRHGTVPVIEIGYGGQIIARREQCGADRDCRLFRSGVGMGHVDCDFRLKKPDLNYRGSRSSLPHVSCS
jgi:hypothetical protein